MIKKEPIALRVSLTNRCNMQCRYCRPAGHNILYTKRGELLPQVWIERIAHVAEAVPISKLRFTGGEPLLYSGIVDVVAGCADIGISELALTTNGLGLTELAKPLKKAGLERVNVSLDSIRPDVFRQITGSRLDVVLKGISAAKDAGLAIKLNTVVQRGYNSDELAELLQFAASEQIHIRYLEMMPIGPAADEFEADYVSGEEIQEELSKVAELEPLWYKQGDTSRDYRATLKDGSTTTCGFILPTSTPFCEGCRRLRLDSAGRLYGCLAQPDTFPLHESLKMAGCGDLNPLRKQIVEALNIKKRPQAFREQAAMIDIGG